MSSNEIEWFRGDGYPIQMTIISSLTKEPIDLTGYSFKMTVNKEKEPVDETSQIFQVDAVVNPDQVANKGKITFTPTSINASVDIRDYYYDVEMITASNHNKTIVKDVFTINQDITKT